MSLTKLGRYDILKPLGKGAMGLVYEAHDPNIDRHVAIKTIRVDQLSDDDAAEYESRFRAEARAGGRLQHPNIIGVYDAGRDQGMAFMVMELVRGGDLKQQLDRGARLTFDRTFAIMRDLLSALSFAHEQGIVHRDIKPANVMLDSNGRVKLGDFGVARITGSGDATRTQGSMVGTLKYMSPEQVQGLQVDARTDLFAAGVVLYQLLTGTKPFEGAHDFAIMQAIANQEPTPPSTLNLSLPHGIDAVVSKALAKDRDQRYQTAAEFMIGLRGAASQARGSGGMPVRPPPAPAQLPGSGEVGALTTGSQQRTGGSAATSPSAVAQEMELNYWKDIQESSDPEEFQDFLEQFPNGAFAKRARSRLQRLARALADGTGQSATGTAPPIVPEAATPTPPQVEVPLVPPKAPIVTTTLSALEVESDAEDATRVGTPLPSKNDAAVRAAHEAEARRRAEALARKQVEEARRKNEEARRAEAQRLREEQTQQAERRKEEERLAEQARREQAEAQARQIAEQAEAVRLAELANLEAKRAEVAKEAAEAAQRRLQAEQAEQARQAEENDRLAREQLLEQVRLKQEAAKAEALRQAEARKAAELASLEAKRAEVAKQAAEEAQRRRQAEQDEQAKRAEEKDRLAREQLLEQARLKQEAAKAEALRQAEARRAAEEERQTKERRQAEIDRQAEAARQADHARINEQALQARVAREAAEAAKAEEIRKTQLAAQAAAAQKAKLAEDAEVARQAEAARAAEQARAQAEVLLRAKAEAERRTEEARQARKDAEALNAKRDEEEQRANQASTERGPVVPPTQAPAAPLAPVQAPTGGDIDLALAGLAPKPAPAPGSPVKTQEPLPASAPQAAGGKGKLIAIAATLMGLAGGGAWLAMRGDDKPNQAAPSPSPPLPMKPAPQPRPAEPIPAPVAAPPPAIPEPAPSPAPAAPGQASSALAQASALERSDLVAASRAYIRLANGPDKKAAADAARRLWEIYRDGGKNLPSDAAQAQRWYDQARKLGVKLPSWSADKAVTPSVTAPAPPPTLPAPGAPVSAPPAPAAPAVPTPAPPAVVTPLPAPTPAPIPVPTPPPAVAPTPSPAPPTQSAPPPPPVVKTREELYADGQRLEASNRRLALGAYRQSAAQGYGPAQKRLWELLKDTQGSESEAARYQREAWDQKVPGVPEPKGPVRF